MITRRIVGVLLCSCFALHALAQAYLLKDINQQAATRTRSVAPLSYNNALYFSVHSDTVGTELWRTQPDGSTALVIDLYPQGSAHPVLLGVLHNRLLFLATQGDGYHLFSTDGTADGTVLVKEHLTPTYPTQLQVAIVEGVLYVSTTGKDLWRTDGTLTGTLNSSQVIPEEATLSHLKAWKTGVAFVTTIPVSAMDNLYQQTLWQSNGTPSGTQTLRTFLNADTYRFLEVVPVEGGVYFTYGLTWAPALWRYQAASGTAVNLGNMGATPTMLTKSDFVLLADKNSQTGSVTLKKITGTTVETLKVISSPVAASVMTPFFKDNSENGWIAVNGQVWRTDGTTAGTQLITQYANALRIDELAIATDGSLYVEAIAPTPTDRLVSEIWRFSNNNLTRLDTLLIVDDNLELPDYRQQQITTLDNTLFNFQIEKAKGTLRLRQATAGSNATTVSTFSNRAASSYPRKFTAFGGAVYFYAVQGDSTYLYKSTGEQSNVAAVTLVHPSAAAPDSLLTIVQTNNNTLFFTAYDNGVYRIFKLDNQGIVAPALAVNAGFTNPKLLAAIDNNVYFAAEQIFQHALYRTNAAATTAQSIQGDTQYSFQGDVPFKVNGKDLYFHTTGNVITLHRAEVAGASPLKEFVNTDNQQPNISILNNEAYFIAADAATGKEIWKTAGTAQSTRVLKDITAGTASTDIVRLTVHANQLYFMVKNGTATDLWRSNGTDIGTLKLTTLFANSNQQVVYMQSINGNLVWLAKSTNNGTYFLWRLNEANSTPQLLQSHSTDVASSYRQFTVGSNSLFYTLPLPDGSYGIWQTDGTAAGSFSTTGMASGQAPDVRMESGKLFFANDDELFGVEPYVLLPQTVALPVQLSHLQATYVENQAAVLLTWQTYQESNNKGFEIQRSLDGTTHWQSMGFVQGAGTTTQPVSYRFWDAQPLPTRLYYRLRQYDYDGTTQVSNIVDVALSEKEAVYAYPNPASSEVHIQLVNLPEQGWLTLTNSSGQTVWRERITQTFFTIDVSDLPTGIYTVEVAAKNSFFHQRLVKY